MKNFLKKLFKPAENKKTVDTEKARKAEAKEKHILSIMEKTGWNREQTVANVKEARERLGITFKDYDRYDFHAVAVEEQEARYKEILEKKEARKQEKEQRIAEIMEKTGWDHDKAKEALDYAKKQGISNTNYMKYALYYYPQKDLEKQYNKRRLNSKKAKKNEKALAAVIEATGWDRETAKEKMDKSHDICGAEYKDYAAYKFWEIDDEQQKTYFTKGHANALRKKYNTKEENVSCFMNKNEFNEIFTDYLGRPWSYNRNITLDEFKKRFENESKIMYKPLSASCGRGICAYEISEATIEDVYNELKALPEGIVEGYIVQHPAMSEYSRNSVNTVRVVTVRNDGEVHLLYAAFRMAGGDAVVDNFHNGGVLAIVDTKTGEIVTDAIDLHGEKYENHPSTGKKIKGFVIPHWDAIVAVLKEAGKKVDGIGYVGWDIAVTENGPVLIEGNTAPAPNVLQLPYAGERKGMKYVIEKYL